MNNEASFLDEIVRALQLLAADYETQISYFPDYVFPPDELALNYSDSFLLADQVLDVGLIERSEFEKLKEIDEIFTRQSQSAKMEFYSLSALRDSGEWEQIRQLAHTLLVIMGKPQQLARSPGTTYVPGKKSDRG